MTSRLGRYTVLGRLAKGSTADVLLAIPDPGHLVGRPRRVVLKRLYPHVATDELLVRMFVDELQLLARFDDDGIVRVYDLDIAGNDSDGDPDYFAVLELVDGPSLSAAQRLHARTQAFPVDVAVAIVARIARALAVVHALPDVDGTPLQLVHRDVTPDNILLDRDGRVLLADFGLARSVVGRDSGTLVSKETTAGTKKGKASWRAPEQLLGPSSSTGAHTDLYALGATLWSLLAGRPPFSRELGDVALFEAIAHGPTPRLRDVVDGIDPGLDDLCAQLMHKDPQQRPQHADDVVTALSPWSTSSDDRARIAAFVQSLGLPSLRA